MMKRLLAALCCIGIACLTIADGAEKSYGNATGVLVSVHDGDTFHVDLCNWPALIGDDIAIRPAGIDTPELYDRRPPVRRLAEEAKAVAKDALTKAKTIELRNVRRGKYFRIVADVFIDGESFADLLLERGLAKPYDGKKKTPWTPADAEAFFGHD